MGNGASLVSPGKKRAQQRADVAAVRPEASVLAALPSTGAAAPITTPETAAAGSDASKGHELPEQDEADLSGDEDALAESEWLSGGVDDALSLLRAQQPGDAFADFTLALALELDQDYDAASRLFRSMLGHRGLGLSAHYHLALCLLQVSTESAGNNGVRIDYEDEAVRCLERVVGAESVPEGDDEAWTILLRNSKELLAHLLVERKEFARALLLFCQLADGDGDNNNEGSTPQALAGVQQAGCLHALGDSLAAAEALDKVAWDRVRKDLPLVAADASSIRSALGAFL